MVNILLYSTNVVYYKGGTVQMSYTTKVVQCKCSIYKGGTVQCCKLQRRYSTNIVYYKGGTVQMSDFLINWIYWRGHSTTQPLFQFWIIDSSPHKSWTLNGDSGFEPAVGIVQQHLQLINSVQWKFYL